MQLSTRRQVIRLSGALAGGTALTGCLGDDGADDQPGSGDDGSPGDVPSRIHDHLRDARGYEEQVSDRRGTETVEIRVGAGSGIAFEPPAVRIDPGTEVVWIWTGTGGQHDVVSIAASDVSFQSERTREEGHEFTHSFDEGGIALYECRPHRAQGMLGAIEVLETEG